MPPGMRVPPIGGKDVADPGTAEWVNKRREKLISSMDHRFDDWGRIGIWLDAIVDHEGWRQMVREDGSAFTSLEEFCTYRKPWGLGRSLEELAEVLAHVKEGAKTKAHVAKRGAPVSLGTEVRLPTAPPIHPAAELFPMLVPAELDALAADIRANGLREPVVIFDGQVIDGRNRLAACKLAGVEPRYRVLVDCPSPVAFVLSTNLHRRHLTESQRGMVGARAKAQLQDEARKRQADGAAMTHAKLGRGEGDASAKFGGSVSGEWADQAAEMVNVGRGTIKSADVVIERGLPELAAAVDAGEVAVSAAAEVAKLPREEQAAVVAAGPKAVKAKAKEAREETKASKKAKAPPAPPPPPRVYDELNRRINHAATLGELDEAMTALRRANDDSTLSEGEHSSLLAGYKARHAELRAEAAKAEPDDAETDVAALADEARAIVARLSPEKAAKAIAMLRGLESGR